MISASTRFLAQPRDTRPTRNGRCASAGGCSLDDDLATSTKDKGKGVRKKEKPAGSGAAIRKVESWVR